MTKIRRERRYESRYDHARYRHGLPLPPGFDDEDPGDQPHGEDRRGYDPLRADGGLHREPGAGAHSEQECFRDQYTYTLPPGFPSGAVAISENGHTPSATTFYAKEAPPRREERFDHIWLIHHGNDSWPECPIKEEDRGLRIDREDRDKYLGIDAAAQTLDVPKRTKKRAIDKVFGINGHSFSRHHGGVRGAVVGFAMLFEYGSPAEAKSSADWCHVEAVCSGLGIDAEGLVEFVFGKYGPDEGAA